jgi:hypothetical protein
MRPDEPANDKGAIERRALDVPAKHFTEEEDAASTLERQVGKSADALAQSRRDERDGTMDV